MQVYTEKRPTIDAPAPTPTATSVAYARALGGATAITKSSVAKLYPEQKEIPRSSMPIQRRVSANQNESIGANLPHRQYHDEENLCDARDQSTQNHCEKSSIKTSRDPIPHCQSSKSRTQIVRHTVRMLPVDNFVYEKEVEGKRNFDKDVEANNLLQSIIHLDAEVTETAAAVYHYFETEMVDVKVSPSGRAIDVIHSIKEELRNGNSKPAYQFLETAKSVLPILLEEREEAGLELEASIFSNDSEESRVSSSHSVVLKKYARDSHDDMRSISEQTAAIFQFLDDAKCFGRGEKSSRSEDPSGRKVSHTRDSDANIFRILEEKEDLPALTRDGIYLTRSQNEFSRIVECPADFLGTSIFKIPPNVDDMDLEFVENFDLAFSEFLYYHPELVAKNPVLLKNLRIYKLQKLLEYNDVLERSNLVKLHAMVQEKRILEESMHERLKDAVRRKAARQTFLQSEVNEINWTTKQIQAKLRWKLFEYSEDRAKRQSKLRQDFKRIPQAKTREDLIGLIPEGVHSKKLQSALKASFIAEGKSQPDMLSFKQEDQLQKIKVENSVLNSEMALYNEKLAYLRNEAKKLEWVQSILIELKPVIIHKLKKKFEKQEGLNV